MKTIKDPNEKIIAFIKTNSLKSDTGWRPSLWTVPFEKDGIYLMKHIFTGEIVSLTEEEYSAPEQVDDLKKRRFIVPTDYNELKVYADTLDVLAIMNSDKPGIKSYTILPTTACNARCTYCYEEGYAISTMTQETAERLVDYICETRMDEEINLAWFGGEPLVGAKTISFICSELSKRDVPFKSSMVSNASLFTPEIIEQAKNVWKLEKIQVSLDGDKNDYNARKRYIKPLCHNYVNVMESIRMLADAGIKVNLRVNFDMDSFERLKSFLDEMKERFGNDKNVSLYLSVLYQEKDKSYYPELHRQMLELNRYIRKLGINYENREKMQTIFKMRYCMADNLEHTVVIYPNGVLYDCEHLPEGHSWGNIFNGVTDKALFDRLSARHEIDEKCKNCPHLPTCTPFFKNGCPGWFEKCHEINDLSTEYELANIAIKLSADG